MPTDWASTRVGSRSAEPVREAVSPRWSSQMAQDRGLAVAFQLLVYPMLDDRTVLEADHEHRGELMWTQSKNAAAWAMFLGHPVRAEAIRPYASAARRADLAGQPPAWIGVGDLDLFYAEDLAYAQRLEEAGVDVELVVVDGMPHGMDFLAWVPRMKAFDNAPSTLLVAPWRPDRLDPVGPRLTEQEAHDCEPGYVAVQSSLVLSVGEDQVSGHERVVAPASGAPRSLLDLVYGDMWAIQSVS